MREGGGKKFSYLFHSAGEVINSSGEWKTSTSSGSEREARTHFVSKYDNERPRAGRAGCRGSNGKERTKRKEGSNFEREHKKKIEIGEGRGRGLSGKDLSSEEMEKRKGKVEAVRFLKICFRYIFP